MLQKIRLSCSEIPVPVAAVTTASAIGLVSARLGMAPRKTATAAFSRLSPASARDWGRARSRANAGNQERTGKSGKEGAGA
jgi:hypothetical protein